MLQILINAESGCVGTVKIAIKTPMEIALTFLPVPEGRGQVVRRSKLCAGLLTSHSVVRRPPDLSCAQVS